jgi:hypothetical protein
MLPLPLRLFNEALAFCLELALLAAVAWWGARGRSSTAASVALRIGAPLLVAIFWGLFAAPKARIGLPLAGILVVKSMAFGAGVAALWALGPHVLAASFATVAAVNTIIATLDRGARTRGR